ncbi:MAG TPA: RagB/SusD family nutrient uptake outer membrane protein [Puia sp.]|nr:RagB/SusD family nutrient uptake outer membrane protein [Puia sp.]
MRCINNYRLFITSCLLALLWTCQGCKKFVDVDTPVGQVTTSETFSNETQAGAAVRGLYYTMMSPGLFTAWGGGLSIYQGLSSDEMLTTNTNFSGFYTNQILPTDTYNYTYLWSPLYAEIYVANSVVTNVEASTGIVTANKPGLEGEAKFVRALCYFYLVNLYDSVPFTTGLNYQGNALLPRTAPSIVYDQIIADLQAASSTLGTNFTAVKTRIRANKWSATALLARAYLYRQRWSEAEAAASAVIGSGIYSLDTLNNVFLNTSNEAILQLVSPGGNLYSWDGLISTPGSGVPTYQLTPILANAFETGDLRKVKWMRTSTVGGVTYYSPYKYQVSSGTGTAQLDPTMILRLTEQYLIRAEARAQQGNTTDAAADLNIIRKRAGLPATTASSATDLLTAIYHERQVELFSELGHRWLDVKRTGQADVIFGADKSGWTSSAALYPIPYTDIQRDPNMTQNANY